MSVVLPVFLWVLEWYVWGLVAGFLIGSVMSLIRDLFIDPKPNVVTVLVSAGMAGGIFGVTWPIILWNEARERIWA